MWDGFRRKKSGKGWTPEAQQLSLRTLAKLHAQGHDATAVIEQSIERGYAGLFPLKADRQPASAAGRQSESDRRIAEFLGETRDAYPDDGMTIDMEAMR